jgi:hypothetical protein
MCLVDSGTIGNGESTTADPVLCSIGLLPESRRDAGTGCVQPPTRYIWPRICIMPVAVLHEGCRVVVARVKS